MTIRKQFIWLIVLIVSIPVFCVIFIPSYRYFTSSDRLLVNGYKELRTFHDGILSEQDNKRLQEILRFLPPDVETAVFTSEFEMIGTNIQELLRGEKIQNPKYLWDYMQNTSTEYFYQFTTMETEVTRLTIVSRIPRQKEAARKKGSYVYKILNYLFIFILLCLFLIILISHTIFRSIEILEKNTMDIASGNLNDEIKIDSKTGENEITSIAKCLEKMRLALLESQNRRNRFVMGLSHDLRTPVAVIKGYTEAISDGMISDPEEIKKAVDIIEAKTATLESMIDTLLNFSRLESNDFRENLVEQDIVPLLKEFARDLEICGNVFKRTIKTSIQLPQSIMVKYDRQLFYRVFENLMNNALRYTKDYDTITMNSHIENEHIILSIGDTGIGISEDDMSHIFDLFYRGTNSRLEEGMGIGLSVVKSVIDTHGWTIDVASEKGKGTEFTISIPYQPEIN